mgnify:CR=1 FL=1
MRVDRNYYGEIINNVNRELEDPSYGTGKIDEYGQPKIDWEYFITGKEDGHGFDTDNKEENGYYYIETELPRGTKLLRFGNEGGYYTAPLGTPYNKLALPYKIETIEYNEYEVIADGVYVKCVVQKGRTAASRNSEGGAIQYYHEQSIKTLVRNKTLKRLTDWWKRL